MGFIVGVVLTCEGVPGKDRLKIVTVDIGNDTIVTIVTNAPNIREGTRTCVATVGTAIEIGGQNETVKKTPVSGVMSEGMVCDSVMLGWAGGAAGLAVQIPASFALGSEAPSSKPRMDGVSVVEAAPELSAKEIKANEKAARKIELAAKKDARLTKKNAEKERGSGAGGVEEADDEEKEEAN